MRLGVFCPMSVGQVPILIVPIPAWWFHSRRIKTIINILPHIIQSFLKLMILQNKFVGSCWLVQSQSPASAQSGHGARASVALGALAMAMEELAKRLEKIGRCREYMGKIWGNCGRHRKTVKKRSGNHGKLDDEPVDEMVVTKTLIF